MKTKLVRPLFLESKDTNSSSNIWSKKIRLNKTILTLVNEDTAKVNLHESLDSYKALLLGNLWKPQQIILISIDPDEKIKEGDIFADFHFGVIEEAIDYADMLGKDCHFKVIAQQSQLSPELIDKLIEEYNATVRFEDFEIEMNIWTEGLLHKIVPKLTNGYITPVEKPSPYTLTEPLDIKALEAMNRIINSMVENFNSKSKNKAFICKDDKLQMSPIHPDDLPSSSTEITYSEQEVSNLFIKYARKLSYEVFTNGIQTPNQSLDFATKWFELNKKK